MKRKLTRTLALVMVLCLTLTQMAMAANTYYLSVSISGPDRNGATKVVSGESDRYNTKDSFLAAEIVEVVKNKEAALGETFQGTELGEIVTTGLSAFASGKTAWNAYVDGYEENVEGGLKALARNMDTKFSALEENKPYTMTYTTGGDRYTVTVTLKSAGGVDGGAGGAGGAGGGGGAGAGADEETTTAPTLLFKDVAQGSYCYDAVYWAVQKGITNGLTADLFGTNEPCTRGQIVTFLWRAAGSPAPKGTAKVPADVIPGSYCYDAVAWALEQGITKGLPDGSFGTNEPCTRAQAVTFLFRAIGQIVSSQPNFTDVDANAFCAAAVAWAVENGVTLGTTATTFSPNDTCTRGQIVTFLYRAYQGK